LYLFADYLCIACQYAARLCVAVVAVSPPIRRLLNAAGLFDAMVSITQSELSLGNRRWVQSGINREKIRVGRVGQQVVGCWRRSCVGCAGLDVQVQRGDDGGFLATNARFEIELIVSTRR
jgi:hypothetical protein